MILNVVLLTIVGKNGNNVLKMTMPSTLPRKCAGITTIILEGDIRPERTHTATHFKKDNTPILQVILRRIKKT